MKGVSRFFILPVLVAFLCTNCARSPKSQIESLPVPVPETYAEAPVESLPERLNWLADFDTPGLAELVQEAVEANFNLQAAAARLESVIANQRITRTARVPSLSSSLNGRRQENNFQNLAGGIAARTFNSFDLGLSAAWEMDIWGKIKNRTQAAVADVEAERANYQAAQFSLAANTLRTWFDTVEAELQIQLAQETLRAFQQNLEVVEASFERGLPDRALDVRLTRANVESARSTLALRTRQRDVAGRNLELLLGRYPADTLTIHTNLPTLVRSIPTGVPSTLLERRPDLLVAERQLAATMERVKAAKKDLLPSINLSASTGRSSGEFNDLLDPDRMIWNIAAGLSQPIFQGGRLLAGVDLAQANQKAALATYAQTALNAFREVETLLAAEDYLQAELNAAQASAAESVAAEELALQQYQRGLVDIITVLESQRRAFTARSSAISVANARLANRINLYLALGGDFAVPSSEPSESSPE